MVFSYDDDDFEDEYEETTPFQPKFFGKHLHKVKITTPYGSFDKPLNSL
jgi:hypothetical protein